MDAPSAAPVRKIAGVGIGGAIATIVIFALSQVGVELNDTVSAAIVLVVTFLIGYLVPSAPGETPHPQPAVQPREPAPQAEVEDKGQWPGVSSPSVNQPRPRPRPIPEDQPATETPPSDVPPPGRPVFPPEEHKD